MKLASILIICSFAFAYSVDSFGSQESTSKTNSIFSPLGLFAFYSFADKAVATGTFKWGINPSSDVTQTSDVERVAGFGIDYLYRKVNSIGFSVGGTYEARRDLNTYTMAFSNGTSSESKYPSPGPSLQIITAIANINYSFQINNLEFYGFGGLNRSFPTLDWENSQSNADGKFGYQLGIGFMPLSFLTTEIGYRFINMEGKIDKSGFVTEFDNMTLNGAFALLRIQPL